MFFKCKHSFKWLIVRKGYTTKKVDEDFNHVTYHFTCGLCHKELDKTYAAMIGGVEGFLARGKNER